MKGSPEKAISYLKFISVIIGFLLMLRQSAQSQQVFSMGDNTSETEFNKISKSAHRANRDLTDLPARVSLKMFAPEPGYQGTYGTCVAWSSSYAARTISYCIQRQLTDPAAIKAVAFSPNYIYFHVKTPGDDNCTGGANIESAMKVLSSTGDLLLNENIADCIPKMEESADLKAKNYSIKTYSALTNMWGRIEKNEYLAIKKCIAEKKPVIFSLKAYKSITRVGADGMLHIPENDTLMGNHALCIVGYDDTVAGGLGAFEVMNSWGTAWGNKGFFWLTYDQLMQYGSYALELMDREIFPAAGNRSLNNPQLAGRLEFKLCDDSGKDISTMPAEAMDQPGKTLPGFRLTGNYPAGQRFKIRFTCNAPAFVYIFAVDDHRSWSRLFPYAPNVSAALNSVNETIYLPSENKGYRINADASLDKIFVFCSKSPLDEELLKSLSAKPQNEVASSLRNYFQSRMVSFRDIQIADGIIQFSTPVAEEEVVAVSADLHH